MEKKAEVPAPEPVKEEEKDEVTKFNEEI